MLKSCLLLACATRGLPKQAPARQGQVRWFLSHRRLTSQQPPAQLASLLLASSSRTLGFQNAKRRHSVASRSLVGDFIKSHASSAPHRPASNSFATMSASGSHNSGRALHIETPLIFSEAFSKHLGADVFLKMDCLQPPGSFKIRGIGETVRQAVDAGASRIVSSSGGNAGLAAAYAAKSLGVPCTVVLPTTTPEKVHGMLKKFGADVFVHGNVWDEADKYARKIVEEQNGAYVHPFYQESTWDGHASLIEELSRQLPAAPDAIVTCVGGGGLLMGILKGLEKQGWSSTRVVACETEGAASMAGSLSSGELITIPITSVAKSLGAQRVGEKIFEKCKELGPEKVSPFVVSDAAAVGACVKLCANHRVLVEPACGAALAGVLEKSDALAGCKTVVVEICGGAIVDLKSLSSLAQELGVLEES